MKYTSVALLALVPAAVACGASQQPYQPQPTYVSVGMQTPQQPQQQPQVYQQPAPVYVAPPQPTYVQPAPVQQPPQNNGLLQIGGSQSNYGQQNVNPGFLPDPINVSVVSGGNIDATGVGSGCNGYVTRQPDYIVHLTGPSQSLRMYVTGGSDTTLVINDANGQFHCNDDSYGGLNPTVDLPGAAPGQYDIWIGSYNATQQAHAVLHVTELDNHP